MKKHKTVTFTYEGLGFPVELIDVPMSKILDEWVMDIDMNKFQSLIFNGLVHKPTRLIGAEIKFMRKFLEISTVELSKKLGVTHAAILKWEKEDTHMSPSQEIYLRMVFFESWKGKEVQKIFEEIRPKKLTEDKKIQPFSVDMKKQYYQYLATG